MLSVSDESKSEIYFLLIKGLEAFDIIMLSVLIPQFKLI